MKLKGTDGKKTLQEARARGARPQAEKKAERALKLLQPFCDRILIRTAAGNMGENACRRLALPHEIVYSPSGEETDAKDTAAAVKAIICGSTELLLFAGGDGTARDVFAAVTEQTLVLGIPAGVKIQSAVFALNPEAAGRIAAQISQGIKVCGSRREVVDLDEDAYRSGRVAAKLYGTMLIPNQSTQLQSMKQSGFSSEQAQLQSVGRYLAERMKPGIVYAVSSGSTAKCLLQYLKLPFELLGIDLLLDGSILLRDASEEQIWRCQQQYPMHIIISPIGGQGFLFGRRNHQFSPRVLQTAGRKGITVISTESKVFSLQDHCLHVDCGDVKTGEMLHGYYNVLCGYGRYLSMPCR